MTRSVRWLTALALALLVHLGPLRPLAPPPSTTAPTAPRTALVRHVVIAPEPMPAPQPPTPAAAGRRQPRPAPPADPGPMPPMNAFVAPPPAALSYEFRQGAVTLAMRFSWAPSAGHYRVALETTSVDGRTATWLRSEGQIGAAGLLPSRHTIKPPGRSEQALTVLREGDTTEIAFSTVDQRLAASTDVQDGLSWLPHWLGHWRASDRSMLLQVAHTDGRLVTLQLARDPGDPWHWSSTPAQPLDDTLELWLSPEPPHWPLRWHRTTPWGHTAEWTANGAFDAGTMQVAPPP